MSLKNFYGEDSSNRAYLVAVALPGEEDTIDRSLDELEDLALTCGFGVVGRVTQNLSSISGATFIGSGKLAEISELAQNADVDHLIFNTELSAAQFR
ncbi:MAG: GTPase HflX, partial [Eubacteriales bacterium]|nr:GTPase HflX [Eubacteriales bacterium]